MDEFHEYLRFPDIEKATEYTSVLDRHGIPFELDDSSQHFSVVLGNNPMENQYILKLKNEDVERAEKVFNKELEKEVKELPPDHYLYTFSDKDILDIIANQNEWTKAEVKLALEIARERKIELSAQSIKSAKKVQEVNPVAKINISNTASWFWVIAVFSIANSIFVRREINFHLPGLAITEVFENVFLKMYGAGNRIGFITCLIISSVFFLFARFGKKNKWVFLSGLIIYTLDSIMIITSFRWGQILVVFIVLWSTITGLVNTFRDEKNNPVENLS